MSPELIEAAARLCGWYEGQKNWWLNAPDLESETMARDDYLTDAGLLAVEDELLHAGWLHNIAGDEGGTPCYHWMKRMPGRFKEQYALHADRHTAAALAAKVEIASAAVEIADAILEEAGK